MPSTSVAMDPPSKGSEAPVTGIPALVLAITRARTAPH